MGRVVGETIVVGEGGGSLGVGVARGSNVGGKVQAAEATSSIMTVKNIKGDFLIDILNLGCQ